MASETPETARSGFCTENGCGHLLSVHGPDGCQGVHADQPENWESKCSCIRQAESVPLTKADLAEAFERGRAAERAFMEQLASYHHWSSISAGPPDLPTNPYRPIRPAQVEAPIHFGYLTECPDGQRCTRPGCLKAHLAATSNRPGQLGEQS